MNIILPNNYTYVKPINNTELLNGCIESLNFNFAYLFIFLFLINIAIYICITKFQSERAKEYIKQLSLFSAFLCFIAIVYFFTIAKR